MSRKSEKYGDALADYVSDSEDERMVDEDGVDAPAPSGTPLRQEGLSDALSNMKVEGKNNSPKDEPTLQLPSKRNRDGADPLRSSKAIKSENGDNNRVFVPDSQPDAMDAPATKAGGAPPLPRPPTMKPPFSQSGYAQGSPLRAGEDYTVGNTFQFGANGNSTTTTTTQSGNRFFRGFGRSTRGRGGGGGGRPGRAAVQAFSSVKIKLHNASNDCTAALVRWLVIIGIAFAGANPLIKASKNSPFPNKEYFLKIGRDQLRTLWNHLTTFTHNYAEIIDNRAIVIITENKYCVKLVGPYDIHVGPLDVRAAMPDVAMQVAMRTYPEEGKTHFYIYVDKLSVALMLHSQFAIPIKQRAYTPFGARFNFTMNGRHIVEARGNTLPDRNALYNAIVEHMEALNIERSALSYLMHPKTEDGIIVVSRVLLSVDSIITARILAGTSLRTDDGTLRFKLPNGGR